MLKFLSNLKERAPLLIVVLIISLVSVFLAYYMGGSYFTISVIIPFITVILTLSKNVWSSDSGQTKVALVSLGVILLLVIGTVVNPTILNVLLEPLYNRIPALKGIIPPVPLTFPVMIVASIVIVAINYLKPEHK